MASIKGTQTERNLLHSFAGEAQARNRYTYYASVAKKEGYVQISKIFEETADQEKEHAKRFFKFLEGGNLEITGTFPAGIIGTTEQNLGEAADGEHDEWHNMYPEFARIAKEEGFNEISAVFTNVSVAEKQHEKRYRALLKNLKENKVFQRDSDVTWRCINCGFLYTGNNAPELCPACAHPKAYFELLAENW